MTPHGDRGLEPPEPDKLDRILRRDAQSRVDDDGFTARVMAALPSPVRLRSRSEWLTPVLVLGSTALGSALAALFAPRGADAAQGFIDLASVTFTPAAIAALATSGALLACAIILATHTD